jgi:hypothetical protein
MAWAHAVAAVIEDAAEQETVGFGPCCLMVVDLHVQLGLDGFKQILIENGWLFTLEDFALESDFADIEAIAKQMCERAPGDFVLKRRTSRRALSMSAFGGKADIRRTCLHVCL